MAAGNPYTCGLLSHARRKAGNHEYDRTSPQSREIPGGADRYTLSADDLLGTRVQLNGIGLELGEDDALPQLKGIAVPAGAITIAQASNAFLAFPNAHNAACQ
jgi:hypothetical protein